VGARLSRQLADAGVRLTVADIDAGRVEAAVRTLGAAAVSADAIYDVEADVFSPNAGGGILDAATIARLRCRAVVGAANEQLADDAAGDALRGRDILYGPDYVVNAGGLLSVLFEKGELDEKGVTARVRGIADTLSSVWARANEEGVPPHRVADRMVEEKLGKRRGGRA